MKTRFPDAKYVDTAQERPAPDILRQASAIILVRHVVQVWLDLLVSMGDHARVFFFMDDDLPSILDDPHLPLGYAFRTAWRYSRSLRRLNELSPIVLVSMPELAEKYGLPATNIFYPLPIDVQGTCGYAPSESGTVTVFYHGTAAHMREIRWLKDVFERVLEWCPEVRFELFGPECVRALYADIPSVEILPPMSWNRYCTQLPSSQRDIGLAPLLESSFNACRSYVKFYDIARVGGVGVFSNSRIFRKVVHDRENGLLVANTVDEWVEAICYLVKNPAERQRLRSGALRSIQRGGGMPGNV